MLKKVGEMFLLNATSASILHQEKGISVKVRTGRNIFQGVRQGCGKVLEKCIILFQKVPETQDAQGGVAVSEAAGYMTSKRAGTPTSVRLRQERDVRWQKGLAAGRKTEGQELEVRKRQKLLLWGRSKTYYFPERHGYIAKTIHFSHPQWNFQLYLKFEKRCRKCNDFCLPPENVMQNRNYVSSVVWID